MARVILNYPADWNIVICLGYEAELVRDAVEALFSSTPRGEKLSFVYTRSFETEGQGLSHTLLAAAEMLADRPFVFHAVDSIIRGAPAEASPDWLSEQNQLVFAPPTTSGNFRYSANRDSSELVWRQRDFEPDGLDAAYTGISHVFEPSRFFSRLTEMADDNPESGETLGLVPSECLTVTLPFGTWIDVGSVAGLEKCREEFANPRHILPKEDEAIWFFNSSVIKVHRDPEFVAGRVERSRALAPHVPNVESFNAHTYTYLEVPGVELSTALGDSSFRLRNFFDFLLSFWTSSGSQELLSEASVRQEYFDFYRDKTHRRVTELCERFPVMNEVAEVNGVEIPPVTETLLAIPWGKLAKITPARVHGDLHPENVIVTASGEFVLLDWRQSLAGSRGPIGDVYYDLGKLAHGLRVDHGAVARGEYTLGDKMKSSIELGIEWGPGKERALVALQNRVEAWGLSWARVLLMESIIYLNIAPLHYPDSYAQFLGYLGRFTAEEILGLEAVT